MVRTSGAQYKLRMAKKCERETERHSKAEKCYHHSEGTEMCYSRISNWKAAGSDQVQGFWFMKTTSLHPKLKQHLQECVNA